jgi:hypothetical protein
MDDSQAPAGRRLILLLALAAAPPFIFILQRLQLGVMGGQWAALADGLNFWTGAHLALTHRLNILFDPAAYGAYFNAQYGGSLHSWAYPPSYLLLALPFGLLPPVAGVLLYDALGMLALYVALRACRLPAGLTAAILLCPATLANLADNQNGALLAACMVAGLFLAETRPWLGGFLIGLLTVKPQLGLLIPVYWLAAGNWRAIAAAGVTALCLVALSTAAFGWSCWVAFVLKIMPFMDYVMNQLTAKLYGPRAMILSPYSLAQQLHLAAGAARALQAGITVVAIVCAVALGRLRSLQGQTRLACLILLTSLATPYIWYYDMIPASLAAVWLMLPGLQLSNRYGAGERLAFAGLWITPGIAAQAAMLSLPTFMPVFVAAMLFMAASAVFKSCRPAQD